MLERIAEGRTDLVFEYVAQGNPATSKAQDEHRSSNGALIMATFPPYDSCSHRANR
jgi:hypothetical protein